MANAGCINAIGFDGCFLRTLQCLDSSNIGVGVQYTAPNPLDDKRFDYITYTDKCGCQCCLTDENEILIYATQGVIKNLTLTNDDTNEKVIVKWTDLFGSNWNKTVVRYKTGSYPSSPIDGILAVEETTQNQYQTNGYSVSGLEDGTTYYFSVFALDGDGITINVQSMSITPEFIFGGYQKVEYIESSGTQYINPNYVANINSEFSLRVSWGTQSGAWKCFFGAGSADNKAYGVQVRIYASDSTSLTAWFCGPGDDDTKIAGLTLNQFYDISLDKTSFKVGNITKTYSVSGTFPSSGINIFRNSYSISSSEGGRNSSIKLAHFQISEGGTPIRNFYPVYRKSDNVIGLLDTVNKVFYTNAGSGTFTKGPDVN